MGRKRKESADKKKKKVTVDVVAREHAGKTTKLYKILDGLIAKHHKHLADAKIAIGWRHEKKEDADGRMWLGSLKKASDLDRCLHEYDFVMLLNHEFCNKAATDEQLEALIDHELCHGQVCHDSHGEVREDERDRKVYRIRKHDVEEFKEIIARHGAWKGDLEAFFAAWKEAKSRPLLDEKNQPRRRGARFGEPAQGAPPTNGHAQSWGDMPIDVLELPTPMFEALQAAEIFTIGKYEAHVAEHGQIGIADLKGFGCERAEFLHDRIEEHRAKHPELFAEVVAK